MEEGVGEKKGFKRQGRRPPGTRFERSSVSLGEEEEEAEAEAFI